MTQLDFYQGSKDFKIDKPIRLIELFAGVGSQSKALSNLGQNIDHYRVCEYDKYAVQSYNAIHNTNFKTSNIMELKGNDLGIVDTDKFCYIMTYSFPCQSLSLAGKQEGMAKGSGTRSGLLWEVERLIKETKELPQVLLMENVPQVHGTKNKESFKQWCDFLEKLGYKNYWKDLNSKNYGIPQNRDRCFMVSILGDYYYEFPQEIKLELKLKDMLESDVEEKYYLSDKMIKYIQSFDDKYQVNEKSLVINRNTATTKTTREGQTRADSSDYICDDLPQETWLNPNNRLTPKENQIAYASTEGVAPACNTCGGGGLETKIIESNKANMHDSSVVINNYRIRKLTPKECWRLMGFKDSDFEKAKASGISNSQLYKQAGNSIVVNVLEAIFKKMI